MKRIVSLLLALICALSLTGCRLINDLLPFDPSSIFSTPDPNETSDPYIPHNNEDTSESASDIAFRELDLEIFRSRATSCTDIYNQYIVSDPAKFGIDPNDVTPGWGEISYEDHLAQMDEARTVLGRLDAIGRENLNTRNRYAFDAIHRHFEIVLKYEDYYYFDEPLTPLNGMHSMLPLSMVCFSVRNADDVENYMILIEDMARVLGDIERFENEKADQGLFMTETALDQVVESCRSFAEKGEESFLISYFEEVLEKAREFGFTEDQCSALRERNRNAVLNEILPAYKHLADALNARRGDCMEFEGACKRGQNAKAYFALTVCDEGATMDDMDTVKKLLNKMGRNTYEDMISAYLSDPNMSDKFGDDISFGSVEKNMEWLTGFIKEYYPEMPAYNLKYIQVPDDIADDFSPAAYLTASYDDYYDNLMLINPTSEGSDDLLTVAHETIPGHMYQFLYARNMKGLSLAQQILEPTGYAEAWTVFTEDFVSKHCDDLDADFCTMTNSDSTFGNIYLPAYVRIMVNYYGWDKDQVVDLLKTYGIESAADIFYEYAITMPVYAMSYAIGYSYLSDIYRSADPGSNNEIKAFFERYLSYGPTYMDIIRDYMK